MMRQKALQKSLKEENLIQQFFLFTDNLVLPIAGRINAQIKRPSECLVTIFCKKIPRIFPAK